MSSQMYIDESVAVQFLEKGGRWQTQQLLLAFIGQVSACFQVLSIVFTGFQPKFTCIDNEVSINGSEEIIFDNKCEVLNTTTNASSACMGGYIYDVGRQESIVSQWDLVCNKAYLAETSQLLYTVGMAIGSIIASPLSDRFGRRRAQLCLRFLYVICCFGMSLAPNIIWFMIGRLLIGTIGMGYSLVVFVYLMEISPARFRSIAIVAIAILWSLALCLEVLLAYLLAGQSWRVIQAVLSIFTLTLILDVLFLKESIMWLIANNRMKEASDILCAAVMKNKDTVNGISQQNSTNSVPVELNALDNSVDVHPPLPIETKELDNSFDLHKSQQDNPPLKNANVTMMDIMKNKTTRIMALIICYCWFVNSMVYYGIFFMSDALAGDRYLNFFLNGVVDIPGAIVLFVCLKYFGRRKPLVGLHGLCAISLLLGGILMVTLKDRTKYIVMQVVGTIGKFGISATFNLVYIYTSEVFPTNFRTCGLGLGSASARLGSFMSPFANVLARQLPWGPGIIFGGLCMIAALLLLRVPETRNIKLPQSIAEVEVLKK